MYQNTDEFNTLISIFRRAFLNLGIQINSGEINQKAEKVYKAMTFKTRNYHSLKHIFTFIDPSDSVRSIAALYHDIVYYQVDKGFIQEIEDIVTPYFNQIGNSFFLAESIDASDTLVNMVINIFNLKPGQLIQSMAALNEFLSSIVLVRELGHIVPKKELLLMIVCIEATIPFRGISHFKEMEIRLGRIAADNDIQLTTNETLDSLRTAVMFANKDMDNFAESDPAKFLVYTWMLLPETNTELRSRELFTVRMYRDAIHSMEDFISWIEPDKIFVRYRGIPTEIAYSKMTLSARNNISTAKEYLRIKLVSIAILEAIVEVSGGDAPLNLIMGNLPVSGKESRRLEYYLPQTIPGPWIDQNALIFRLLETGRAKESGFDMRNSPLSLFIYKSLSPQEMNDVLSMAKGMFSGSLSEKEFLANIDRNLISSIAQAIIKMVPERREKLEYLITGKEL